MTAIIPKFSGPSIHGLQASGHKRYSPFRTLHRLYHRQQKQDPDFKQKAVELSFAKGNAREIGEESGIRPELLYRWRREYQNYENNSFPGKEKPKMIDFERENSRLRKAFQPF